MKTLYALLILVLLFISCSKEPEIVNDSYYDISSEINNYVNHNHPKAVRYQELLNKFVYNGAPGVLMLIKTPNEGIWAGASGFADINSSVLMKTNFISRIGSITKTFVAVTILKLFEEGKLQLDEKANKYIPSSICNKIENCNIVTIRQLLNHTSGIYNNNEGIDCKLEYFNNPEKEWTWEEALEYAYGKNAYFKPGENLYYSNTNYILLSLIIDNIEGKNHSEVMKEKIFVPLGMNSTFYNPVVPIPTGTIRGYWDIHNDGYLSDATDFHYSHRLAEGGMVSSLYDMMIFAEALYKGNLLSDTTFNLMKQWNVMPDSKYFSYGLGLRRWDSAYGECWGHNGDASGYNARMYIFPDSETVIIFMTNGSEGKIEKAITDFLPTKDQKREIFDEIFDK